MKPIFSVLTLLLVSTFSLFAQTPDCQWTDTFSSATNGASHSNTSEGNNPCVAWRVTYDAIGMTGVSLQIEGAPYNSIGTGPGTFAAIASGAVVQGTNPLTDPNSGTLSIGGTVYYPFIRINVTTFTPTGASGSIRVRTYGYKGTSAIVGASGGGGGNGCGLKFNVAVTNISMGSNEITAVPSCQFTGLTALQNLDLDSNQLSTLPSGVFTGLTALQTLDLDSNQLSTLPSGIFTGLTALQYLYLYSNQLSTLPSGVFTGLTALQTLYLDTNQLTALPSGVFTGLTALQNLTLNNNQLTTLETGVVDTDTALTTVYADANALDATGVNNLLASLVTAYGVRTDCISGACIIDVAGGTSAAPTTGPPDGIAAVLTLVAAGWSVTTN